MALDGMATRMETTQTELLKGISLFGGLRDEAVEYLLSRCPLTSRSKGEYFFREGEPAGSLFVLQTGAVAILKTWKDRDYVLRRLESRDCFGEMALMDLGPRSASVLAIDDCTAIEVPPTALDKLYRAFPAQYTLLEMNMGRQVSRRLRDANEQLFRARVQVKLQDGEFHFYTV